MSLLASSIHLFRQMLLARSLQKSLLHQSDAQPLDDYGETMTQIFSFKSAAMLCVATLAMCFAGQDANAQCRGGGGFGGFSPGFSGTSININRGGVSFGYSSGFRGINYGYGGVGGFGYAPAFVTPVYRPNNFYGGGFYCRPYGGVNINYSSSRYRPYGYYGGHHHRR